MATSKACCCFLLTLFMLKTSFFMPSFGETESEILLRFRVPLTGNTALSNWNNATDICTWTGVICQKGIFRGLRLENLGLGGVLDMDSLALLTNLRSFSIRGNNFYGQMPAVNKIGFLRVLYLSNNKFSGQILDNAFQGMGSLKKVYMEGNGFTGQIPKSLVDLAQLNELDLSSNHFEGQIPGFQQRFIVFSLANNLLEGSIPASLSNLSPVAFAGNKGLCGPPLPACSAVSISPGNNTNHPKNLTVIIVAVVIVFAATVLAGIYYLSYRRTKNSQKKWKQDPEANETAETQTDKGPKEVVSSGFYSSGFRESKDGDLQFVREDKGRFNMQELLKASAQVLGNGSLGSSYKAVVSSGTAFSVKRFKHMNNVGKQEFYAHMKKLGRLSHPNILPLVAFYYRREEKLLVYDFVDNGSLASHLHAKRAPGEPSLDWPTRLKIIKGVARGLAYLYSEFHKEMIPHGHLKSSNVLLDQNFEPLLTEYGLVPVVSKNHANQHLAAYKSPEMIESDRPTRKTDVWCLGILILELLTGKFPSNYLKHGKKGNTDLAAWVNSVVMEEWTGEVFDKEMTKGTRNGEGEMLKLLKIGMCCCEWGAEERWDWREAVGKIEELKDKDSEEDYPSFVSEADVSKPMTEDDFAFSVAS